MLRNKFWLAFVLIMLSVFISACNGAEATPSVATQVMEPTIYVTRHVTQIVATRPPPTATPIPPPPSPTATVPELIWARIYYPIAGCAASRLHVDDIAIVAAGEGRVGIHPGKDIFFSPPSYYPEVGEELDIKDGPWCDHGWILWKVATLDKEVVGFMAEGNGEVYWLLPSQ